MRLFGSALPVLQQGMKAAAMRQAAIADNLANATTPGYKASRVSFEDQLRAALSHRPGTGLVRTHAAHLGGGTAPERAVQRVAPLVVQAGDQSRTPDGNNVDMELEMARLGQNQVWYSAMVRQVTDHLARIRLAITGGR